MEKFVALFGLAAIVGAAVCMSNNRRAINWRTVAVGIGIQLALALLILKVPGTRDLFALLGQGVEKLLGYAVEGATFVFGKELAQGQFIFAVRIGASIIFIAALSSFFYYVGIMQKVVSWAARGLTKTMGVTGPEAVSAASAVFVGQVECQVLIKPYLPHLTQSELFCSLAAAMATISGSALVAYTALGMNPTFLIAASIMSAPAGIVMAKIMCPETEHHALVGEVKMGQLHTGTNAFDALAVGARDGAHIAYNVMVMVLVAVALVALINGVLAAGLSQFGISWTIQDIFGVCFTPVAWMLGTPWHESFHVGRLIATEILVNEFAAYDELAKVIAGTGAYALSMKTQLIATMALCGFANLGSIAINIGGLGAMAPERRSDVARLAMRALIAANFATWMTAAIAGLLF